MNNDREQTIKQLVKEISQKSIIRDDDSIIPTDLYAILEKEKIDLRLVDESFIKEVLIKKGDGIEHSVDGALVYNVSISEGKKHTIIISRELHDESRERARFTVAHELGHYFLHSATVDGHIVDPKFMSQTNEYSQSEQVEEIEADHFATELLMPKDDVRAIKRSLSRVMSPNDLITFIANRFDVSFVMAKRRLNSLDGC